MSSEKRITPKRKSIGLADKEAIWGWILVSAWMAGFFIFVVGPLALSLVMSFFKHDMITQLKFL